MLKEFALCLSSSPKHYQSDPIKTLNISLNGSFNMLKIAKYNSTILLASSSEVYGDGLIHPQVKLYRISKYN